MISLNPKLLSMQLNKGCRSIFYVSMKEVGILYVQFVCERRVLREFYLSVRGDNVFILQLGSNTFLAKGFIIILEGKMWRKRNHDCALVG